MQLSRSWEARQAKENLGSVSPLLCPEEDNGLASLEAAATQAQQHGFPVMQLGSLQATEQHSLHNVDVFEVSIIIVIFLVHSECLYH